MKIGIVHLSDIHFRTEQDEVMSRVNEVAAAATSQLADIDAYLVAVTGDIANWGIESEYLIAKKFFNALHEQIRTKSRASNSDLKFVFVPGNHDCDFKSDKNKVEVRDVVLKTLGDLESIDFSGGIVETCLSVQANYFNFCSDIEKSPLLKNKDRIIWIREFKIADETVRFHCLNTAWVSKITEVQGQHLFPVSQAKGILESVDSTADIAISILHHPFNWFESSNARALEMLLDKASDVIMTGHEHVESQFTKSRSEGQNVQYFSAGVLQDWEGTGSSFSLVLLDTEKKLQKTVKFVWNGRIYAARLGTEWLTFNRNRFLQKYGLLNNDTFDSYLNDLGTEFTHPFRRSGAISLDELYIPPDANEYPFDPTEPRKKVVKSEHFLKSIFDAKYSVIYGVDNSGKTALSKVVYRQLKKNELVPLLLRPKDGLSTHDEISLRECLSEAIVEQYSREAIDQIFQLPIERRALIIDDFHRFSMSMESRRTLLKSVQKLFGTVIVFATDLFQYQAIIDKSNPSKTSLDYTEYKIREFGRRLRGKLIRNWLRIGRELIVDPKDIAKEENTLEGALNATISRNVIPSYPFWIISIIQLWSSEKSNNGSFGAFGYIFDGLISRGCPICC